MIDGKKQEEVIQLIALISVLISAKFLEMTYPGVERLNRITQSSYTYDEYIQMERHVLQTLNWELHIVTHKNILDFFLSQGVIFTSDSIISYRE
jgi:hypothetical protein